MLALLSLLQDGKPKLPTTLNTETPADQKLDFTVGDGEADTS